MRGVLKFENAGQLETGRSVRLRILDTSRVGADSFMISEHFVAIPEGFDAQRDRLSFEIASPEKTAGLTLHAHLASHDGTDVRSGDMITTSAIPVSGDNNKEITVSLHRL